MNRNAPRNTARLALSVAAVLVSAAVSQAHATTLDKLIGKSITVGNLVFSNFQAPSFSGTGPSAIDVQGLVVTDPLTGQTQTGLRFVAPMSQSTSGGPHEIVMNVLYAVTDLAGQPRTITQSINASASGQAAVYYFTQASPKPGFVADNELSVLDYCIQPTGPQLGCASEPATSTDALFPGSSYFVEHQVQLLIANKKGVTGATTTLQEFDVLYAE